MQKQDNIEKSFDLFSPKEYLEEYYSHFGPENDSLVRFFAYTYKKIPQNVRILEFGGGPTIYQIISASAKASEIYFTDYLDINLEEVKDWKNKSKKMFHWKEYIKKALQYEGIDPTTKNIAAREDLIRKKINFFLHCDAFKNAPLGEKYTGFFDIVSVNFVPESIASNIDEWKNALRNITTLLRKDGTLIMTALKGAKYWHMGDKTFPAANIDEDDVSSLLKEIGFKTIHLETEPAETLDENGHGTQGFDGIIFVVASL